MLSPKKFQDLYISMYEARDDDEKEMRRLAAAERRAGKSDRTDSKTAEKYAGSEAKSAEREDKKSKGKHIHGYAIGEAVYGGGKKEPEDKRMVVTKADKTGNTKAWQNFKAGNPSYKAASHLQKSSFEPEGDSVDEGLAQAHKIAKKIEAQEAVDPQSSLSPKQKDTEQQQTLNAKAKLERILATRKGTYQEETELDELNRLEKETGKDIKGKPVVKGGTMGGDDTHSKVMRHMHKVMGAGRMGAGGAIQPRGVKKQKGEPTPGPSITPAQKVAKRRAAAQRAQDNMSSRYD